MALRTFSWAVLLAINQLSTNVLAASFGCRNSLISDEWRQKVLSIHNDNRSKLAKGQQEGDTAGRNLPIAVNMNKLTWDCNLEELARGKAVGCPDAPIAPLPPAGGAEYGIASKRIMVAGNCEPVSLTDATMQGWWTDGAKKQANQNVVANNNLFSQMAYHKSNAFACTYQTCPTDLYLLCIYNQKVGNPGTGLYTNAAGAAPVCSNCGAVGGVPTTCANGLCLPPFSPAKLPFEICPLCDKPLTNDFRSTVLNMHNYYRRTLATGWAKDGKEGVEYAARAKKMVELVYDKASEDAAWAVVNACPAAVADSALGKNVFKSDNFNLLPELALQEAIEKWWSPLSTSGLGADTTYTAALQGSDMKTFANMAHDGSSKIGCAAKNCGALGYTVIECRYDPIIAVNTKIYETGAPCQCSAPSTCTQLGGLCSTPP